MEKLTPCWSPPVNLPAPSSRASLACTLKGRRGWGNPIHPAFRHYTNTAPSIRFALFQKKVHKNPTCLPETDSPAPAIWGRGAWPPLRRCAACHRKEELILIDLASLNVSPLFLRFNLACSESFCGVPACTPKGRRVFFNRQSAIKNPQSPNSFLRNDWSLLNSPVVLLHYNVPFPRSYSFLLLPRMFLRGRSSGTNLACPESLSGVSPLVRAPGKPRCFHCLGRARISPGRFFPAP
jgi:hypothetical protein